MLPLFISPFLRGGAGVTGLLRQVLSNINFPKFVLNKCIPLSHRQTTNVTENCNQAFN